MKKTANELKVGDIIVPTRNRGMRMKIIRMCPSAILPEVPHLSLQDAKGKSHEHDTGFDDLNSVYNVETGPPIRDYCTGDVTVVVEELKIDDDDLTNFADLQSGEVRLVITDDRYGASVIDLLDVLAWVREKRPDLLK